MTDYTLDILKQIASAIAAHFGDNCEVLIHDLHNENAENSIVYIVNGHVTKRKVGDGPSGAVLNALKHNKGHLTDKLSYLTRTEDGRILKSSTIYIHDKDDTPKYLLSINYDITNLLAFESSIRSLISCDGQDDKATPGSASPKIITPDVNNLLDQLIEQSVALVGVPVPLMTKEEKIKAINFLNDAGAFLITKSGDKVAKYFGISKYTLYSYVDINK